MAKQSYPWCHPTILRAALQVLDDGRMMVTVNGGGANSYSVRLNPDGTLDPSFGVGGVVAGASLPNGDFLFTSAVTTPQGTTIAGYRALTPGIAYVVRLDASGSPVLGFGNNGTYTLDPDTSSLRGACVTALGQVVVTGLGAVRPEHGHSRCAVFGQPRRHRTTCSRC